MFCFILNFGPKVNFRGRFKSLCTFLFARKTPHSDSPPICWDIYLTRYEGGQYAWLWMGLCPAITSWTAIWKGLRSFWNMLDDKMGGSQVGANKK